MSSSKETTQSVDLAQEQTKSTPADETKAVPFFARYLNATPVVRTGLRAGLRWPSGE